MTIRKQKIKCAQFKIFIKMPERDIPIIPKEDYNQLRRGINTTTNLFECLLLEPKNINKINKNFDLLIQINNIYNQINTNLSVSHKNLDEISNHDMIEGMTIIKSHIKQLTKNTQKNYQIYYDLIPQIRAGLDAIQFFTEDQEYALHIMTINKLTKNLTQTFNAYNEYKKFINQKPLNFLFKIDDNIKNNEIKIHQGILENIYQNMFKNSGNFNSNQINILIKKENNFIKIYFEDNGQEIDQGKISKIFEFGYTSRKFGSGIGLGAAREKLDIFDAKIEYIPSDQEVPFERMPSVKDSTQYGSLFCISIPVNEKKI